MAKKQLSVKSRQCSKQDQIIKLLKRKNGATLADLGKVTEWQEHSLRGFISGTLKKRFKLNVSSKKDHKGLRCYRIEDDRLASSAVPAEKAGQVE